MLAQISSRILLEQDTGVEPAFTAWETQKRVFLLVHRTIKSAVFATVFRILSFREFRGFSRELSRFHDS